MQVLKIIAATAKQELTLEEARLAPALADRYHRLLAAWFAFYSEEVADLQERTNEAWLKVREDVKSDGRAQRIIDQTDDGKRLQRLKIRLKYMARVIASLRDHLRNLNEERWQQKSI